MEIHEKNTCFSTLNKDKKYIQPFNGKKISHYEKNNIKGQKKCIILQNYT